MTNENEKTNNKEPFIQKITPSVEYVMNYPPPPLRMRWGFPTSPRNSNRKGLRNFRLTVGCVS